MLHYRIKRRVLGDVSGKARICVTRSGGPSRVVQTVGKPHGCLRPVPDDSVEAEGSDCTWFRELEARHLEPPALRTPTRLCGAGRSLAGRSRMDDRNSRLARWVSPASILGNPELNDRDYVVWRTRVLPIRVTRAALAREKAGGVVRLIRCQ
jgi:hypothetical protein